MPRGRRLSIQVPATSGYRPMETSGMAKRVVPVTMRWLAPSISPTPPPITIPLAQHSTGLG